MAQLDYGNTESGLWDYMLDVCKYYISLGFRGFRCDAADQIPPAFWSWLINEVRKTDSDILFIGEAFLCEAKVKIDLANAGFDYIYNSSKWWDYKSDWLMDEYSSTCNYISSISFPDNHDTRRLMDEVNGNTKKFLQHLYFTAFWSQGFQITNGTEFGLRNQLNCVTTRSSHQEIEQYDFTEHIKEVINLRKSVLKQCIFNKPPVIKCTDTIVVISRKALGLWHHALIENTAVNVDLNLLSTEVTINLYNCMFSGMAHRYTFNCIDSEPKSECYYKI